MESSTTPTVAAQVQKIETVSFETGHAFFENREELAETIRRRNEREATLVVDDSKPIVYDGRCGICDRDVQFSCDWSIFYTSQDGSKQPVWRERLVCPCGISNRLRAALHFMLGHTNLQPDSSVYLTEQTTPFFDLLDEYCTHIEGSEFLSDGTPKGQDNAFGLRHEDITDLSFDSNSFDIVGSFEVLEHVPDYRAGLSELARVLKPGGHLVATFPFRLDLEETLVRAKIDEEGNIVHILEPEYHGDPLSADGVLCYYHFGWDILDAIRAAGFSKAECHFCWSWESGYLGGAMSLFHAVK